MDEQKKSLGIGKALTEARLAAGLQMSDVVTALKIREVHLQALEDEAFDTLPGDAYVLGFIGTYAAFLSLDADALVAQYKATSKIIDKRNEVLPLPVKSGTDYKPYIIGAVALAVLLSLGVGGWLVARQNKERVSNNESPARVETIATSNSAGAGAVETKSNKPQPKKSAPDNIPADIKNIDIRAIGRTWMRIESNGEENEGAVLFSSIVNEGDRFTLATDKTYRIATHDAGALAFFLGETHLQVLGQKAQLLTGHIITPAHILRTHLQNQSKTQSR